MSEIRVDTISEKTSANGVSIDGVTIKDGGITATTGAIVFNEASADVDFRVESNANTHMLFVDGGNNKVGIGESANAPMGTLHIKSADSGDTAIDGNNDDLVIENDNHAGITISTPNDKVGALYFSDPDATAMGRIVYDHSTDHLSFTVNNAERMKIDSTGAVTMPAQPAVLAISTAAQNDIATGVVKINLDTEIYDQNSDFNTGTNTFTAPVTGKYMVSGQIGMTDVDTAFQWIYMLFTTSNRIYYMDLIDPRIEISSDGTHTWTGSALVDMDANDTLYLATRSSAHGAAQNNITAGTATAPETLMSVYLAC